MEYYFKTNDLAVGYDGNILIHDINVNLEKGKILTLIGPNGAGKSTILKSITRQLETIRGTYRSKECFTLVADTATKANHFGLENINDIGCADCYVSDVVIYYLCTPLVADTHSVKSCSAACIVDIA